MKGKIIAMLSGNAFYALSQFISFVIIARYFSSETLGFYAYSIALCVPVYTIGNLGYRSLFATDCKKKYSSSDFIYARAIITTLISFLFFVYAAYGFDLSKFLIFFGVVMIKNLESNFDILIGIKQREDKYKEIAILNICRSAIYVSVILFGAILNLNLHEMLYIIFVAWLFIYLKMSYFFYANKHESSLRNLLNNAISFSVISAPFGLIPILAALNLNIPRVFIENYMGYESLAKYAIMYQFIFIGTIIVTAVGQAILPRLASLYAEKKQDEWSSMIIKIFKKLMQFILLYVIFVWLYGDDLVLIIFGNNYNVESWELLLIAIMGGASYALNILNYILQSVKDFKRVSFWLIYNTMIHIILSLLLIQLFGIVGAIMASTIYLVINIYLIIIKIGMQNLIGRIS